MKGDGHFVPVFADVFTGGGKARGSLRPTGCKLHFHFVEVVPYFFASR
jgi:hypothetical protein